VSAEAKQNGRRKGAAAAKQAKPRARKDAHNSRNSREGLLQAAVKLFAKYGFDGVTTGDIAAAAGYSQAIIHYHFGSKDQLWQEALTYQMHDLDARFPLDRNELRDLKPADRLRVVVRRFIALSRYNTDLASIMVRETLADSDRLKWLINRHFLKRMDFLDELINELVRTGEAKDIPSYIVTQNILTTASLLFCLAPMIALVHGVDLRKESEGAKVSDALIDLFMTGLLKS